MLLKNVKIGADPELFLMKDGLVISAEGYIGGTKHEPKPISDKGHCIQEDNVMIEFNIPACNKEGDFVDAINYVKEYLDQLAKIHGCTLGYMASANINKKYLNTPQAKMFGCEPDLNVYLKRHNDAPRPGGTLRSCGGHIHIGYDNPEFAISEKIVYAMDLILGVESILLDKDEKRRQMYGSAGSFRPKDYGVEYRTLSNFWISSDELTKWAFNKSLEAVELVNNGQIDNFIKEYSEMARTAIDTSNKELANNLIKKLQKQKVCVE